MNFFSRHYTALLILPAALSLASLLALLVWGLKPGIDLAGGSMMQVTYQETLPSVDMVENAIAPLSLGDVRVQQFGTDGLILRTSALSNDDKNELEQSLRTLGSMQVVQFTSIGPSLGAEMLNKGYIAIGLISLLIIAFIAFAFRHVSEPVSSWKYGVVTIVTLVHDMLLPAGVFAALGHFSGTEVDSLFIVALLTILGISINDTIVVFDRVRENVFRGTDMQGHKDMSFADLVGASIMQTLARSINTSLSVLIVLASLWYFGPVSTKDFALTLLVGMVAGTYSSIFLASPLLVLWEKRK